MLHVGKIILFFDIFKSSSFTWGKLLLVLKSMYPSIKGLVKNCKGEVGVTGVSGVKC